MASGRIRLILNTTDRYATLYFSTTKPRGRESGLFAKLFDEAEISTGERELPPASSRRQIAPATMLILRTSQTPARLNCGGIVIEYHEM